MIDYYLAWGADGGESDFSKMEAHWQTKTSPCLEHNLRREKGAFIGREGDWRRRWQEWRPRDARATY